MHLYDIMAIRQVEKSGEMGDDLLYLLGKINHDQKKLQPAIFSFVSLKNKYPNSIFIEESLFLQSDAYYKQIMELKNFYQDPEIFLTENGCAYLDEIDTNGKIIDNERMEYYQKYYILESKNVYNVNSVFKLNL